MYESAVPEPKAGCTHTVFLGQRACVQLLTLVTNFKLALALAPVDVATPLLQGTQGMHRHCWPLDCCCMCSLLGSVPLVLFEPAFIQQRCVLLQADLLRGVAISGLSALPASPSVLGGVPLGDSPLAQAFAVSDVACFCQCSLSWLISTR